MDFIDLDVPFFHFYLVESTKITVYTAQYRVQSKKAWGSMKIDYSSV